MRPATITGLALLSALAPSQVVYLTRTTQYTVTVGASSANAAKAALSVDPLDRGLYSVGWTVLTSPPKGYKPPPDWPTLLSGSALSVDDQQAGYLPSPPGFAGDRRLTPLTRTLVVVDAWPMDLPTAQGFVAGIYSAGRPMTLAEWIGHSNVGAPQPDLSWWAPTPLPWGYLAQVAPSHSETWRAAPLPVSPPYDASIR